MASHEIVQFFPIGKLNEIKLSEVHDIREAERDWKSGVLGKR